MLRGVHDFAHVPSIIALIGYWAIGAPVGMALGFGTSLGAVGVWIGLALGLAVVAVLLMSRWLNTERRGFLVRPWLARPARISRRIRPRSSAAS